MQEKAPRKKSVNLSIDAKLLEEARARGANLSAVLEEALTRELRASRFQAWRKDNSKAIEESNCELESNGMWYTPDWGGK